MALLLDNYIFPTLLLMRGENNSPLPPILILLIPTIRSITHISIFKPTVASLFLPKQALRLDPPKQKSALISKERCDIPLLPCFLHPLIYLKQIFFLICYSINLPVAAPPVRFH